MSDFRLPDVGEGLDQAEIVEWLVAEGDEVARDQPLVEILTDKSQTQLPSPTAGVISRLAFAEGDMAAVGDVLVEYRQPISEVAGEPTAASMPVRSKEQPIAVPPGEATTQATDDPSRPTSRRPKAAPIVRRNALEAGVDLRSIVGSGPGGRITDADLRQAIEERTGGADLGARRAPQSSIPARSHAPLTPPPAAPAGSSLGQMAIGTHPLRGIRRVTAAAMDQSWKIPHIHGADEIDASALLQSRRHIRELQPDRAARLTPLSFFVMAVAHALRRYPLMNASIEVANGEGGSGSITVHDDVNIGIAVATEQGLLVPVIRHADQRSLFDLADEVARLSSAARDRSIGTIDLQQGTCTVSNYGSMGGRYSTPIIRAPEVAIVGFGAIRERPIVVAGEVAARPTLPIAVAADHRLIDGDLMTAFQEHILTLLAAPAALLAR